MPGGFVYLTWRSLPPQLSPEPTRQLYPLDDCSPVMLRHSSLTCSFNDDDDGFLEILDSDPMVSLKVHMYT